MPTFKSKRGNSFHAMNPAQARAKAAADDEAGEGLDQANSPSNGVLDSSDFMPAGHKLSGSISVSPADNGATISHDTEPIAAAKKGEDSWSRRVEHKHLATNADDAGDYIKKVLHAHFAKGGKASGGGGNLAAPSSR